MENKMNLKPPDSSLADYQERRSAFLKTLHGTTPQQRFAALKEWIDANSPYSQAEKLANLRAALREEGII
jgi:hypothetical protein